MTRRRYNTEEVIHVLNEVVRSNPARKDEAASEGLVGRYARHGKPCCLVGEVLVKLGASVSTLKDLDREAMGTAASRHPFWGRFDPPARDLMAAMQRKNDAGLQWGQVQWVLFQISPYWVKVNPKFAYPGAWCTDENGHVSSNPPPTF